MRSPNAKKQLPNVKAYWLTDFKKQEDGSLKPIVDEVIATLKRTGADAVDAKAMPEHFDEAFIQKLARRRLPRSFTCGRWMTPQVARFYRELGRHFDHDEPARLAARQLDKPHPPLTLRCA